MEPGLNYAPYYGDVYGSGGVHPRILDLHIRYNGVNNFIPLFLQPLGPLLS